MSRNCLLEFDFPTLNAIEHIYYTYVTVNYIHNTAVTAEAIDRDQVCRSTTCH